MSRPSLSIHTHKNLHRVLSTRVFPTPVLTPHLTAPALTRYPGSTFMDHVLRYQDTPGVKMIVVLGEVSLFGFDFFSFYKSHGILVFKKLMHFVYV